MSFTASGSCSTVRGRVAMRVQYTDSDYDLAVFLKDLTDRWAEADRIAIISSDILHETGEMIHAMPFRAGSYRERTPLMHEIRREGQDLLSMANRTEPVLAIKIEPPFGFKWTDSVLLLVDNCLLRA